MVTFYRALLRLYPRETLRWLRAQMGESQLAFAQHLGAALRLFEVSAASSSQPACARPIPLAGVRPRSPPGSGSGANHRPAMKSRSSCKFLVVKRGQTTETRRHRETPGAALDQGESPGR